MGHEFQKTQKLYTERLYRACLVAGEKLESPCLFMCEPYAEISKVIFLISVYSEEQNLDFLASVLQEAKNIEEGFQNFYMQ